MSYIINTEEANKLTFVTKEKIRINLEILEATNKGMDTIIIRVLSKLAPLICGELTELGYEVNPSDNTSLACDIKVSWEKIGFFYKGVS